jgi:hypothetical protein
MHMTSKCVEGFIFEKGRAKNQKVNVKIILEDVGHDTVD